jgi:hypothetical protein
VISDGAATDGRPPLTNAGATSIISRAQELITWYEGTGSLAATVGRDTTIVAVAINGKVQF